MDCTILINKNNPLSSNYVPSNLIITDQNENNFHNYKDPNLKPMIIEDIYKYFQKMREDALKENIHIIIDSGYRSYEYQQMVWNKNVEEIGLEQTKKAVAKPGTSEHQSGLAIDIAYIINGKYTDDINENQLETKWLFTNSYKYGFILRYPKDKEEITGYKFEPWHYRFVGIPLATLLKTHNITLEEYYINKDYYDNLSNQKILK